MREEALVLGVLSNETTHGTANLGVLAHKHNTLATESLANLVHLVGADIVDVDDHDGG